MLWAILILVTLLGLVFVLVMLWSVRTSQRPAKSPYQLEMEAQMRKRQTANRMREYVKQHHK